SQLIPIILNNIKLLNPNEHKMEFEKRKTEALIKENEILAKIKKLPRGNRKAKNIQRKIKLLRTYLGMREDPKYYIVKRFYIYKKTILKEAERLKKEGVIKKIQDIYYLYLDEFRDAIINKTVDYSIIEERREKYKHYEKLTPPRVITSDEFVPASTSDSVHSAIITREYGLPGVVGVENATKLIKDGQRIRVNGTDGYVEILD
ncbi:MAG: PEP-utilizing enzyme, partial [Neofamilia sp.]